jgi:hypothetical protein
LANQHTKGAEKALTDQQQLFCDHFLKWGNSTQAAEHAGYSHPDVQAVRLLSKPHIKQHIQRAIAARAMGFAPDMIDQLAAIAMDTQDVAPKDRIAAAVAVLDRAGLPNGRQGPTINVDASQKTLNVTGQDVAQLIAETWQRGRGQLAKPPEQITDQSEIEEAEVEPIDEDFPGDEDGSE